MRDFSWEFEQHIQDAGINKKDTKIHLVLALKQDTLGCLDPYITMQGGNEMAHPETIQDRLHQVPYFQTLVYLK